MDRENRYYKIIENLVRNHRKFSGMEPILDDLIDDVYRHSEAVIDTLNNETLIQDYLQKVVSTSIITVPKRLNFAGVSRRQTASVTSLPNAKKSESESIAASDEVRSEENIQKQTLDVDNSISEDVSSNNISEPKANPNFVDKMINSIDVESVIDNLAESSEAEEINSEFEEIVSSASDSEPEEGDIEEIISYSDVSTVDDLEELEVEAKTEEDDVPEAETEDIIIAASENSEDEELSYTDDDAAQDISISEQESEDEQEDFENNAEQDDMPLLFAENEDEEPELNLSQEPEAGNDNEDYNDEAYSEAQDNESELEDGLDINLQEEDNEIDSVSEESEDTVDSESTEPVQELVLDEREYVSDDDGYDESEMESVDILDVEEDPSSIDSDSYKIDAAKDDTLESDDNYDISDEDSLTENDGFEEEISGQEVLLEDYGESDEILNELSDAEGDENILSMEAEDLSQNIDGQPEDNDELSFLGDDDILESDDDSEVRLLEEDIVQKEQGIIVQSGGKQTDYSVFNYTPSIEAEEIDEQLLNNELRQLDSEYPNLRIIEIFDLKYKQQASIAQIAEKLETDKIKVINALEKIVSLV